jgi:DNA-binding transcriptional LysR family regulator
MSQRNLEANPLNIDELRALVALVDQGSVTAAANALEVGQPVLSRRLSVFKQDAPVLRRRGKGLVLTRRGRELIPQIRRVLHEFDEVQHAICGADRRSARIVLGTGAFAAEHYLPVALAEFSQSTSARPVSVRMLRGQDRIVETALGVLDLAIVSHSPEQVQTIVRENFGESLILIVESISRDKFAVLAHRSTTTGRSLATVSDRRPLALSRLAGAEIVGLDEGSGVRAQVERMAQEQGTRLQFSASGLGWRAAVRFARSGLGVALTPEVVAREECSAELVLRRLSPRIEMTSSLIFAERDAIHLSALRRALAVAARRPAP